MSAYGLKFNSEQEFARVDFSRRANVLSVL